MSSPCATSRLTLSSCLVLAFAPTALGECPTPVFTQPRVVIEDAAGGSGVPPLAGDFEEDGRTDLFVETLDGFALLANRAGGAVWERRPVAVRPGTYLNSPRGRAAATGDLDGDGHLDVVLLRDTGISLLLGDGAGAFHETPEAPVASRFGNVAVADFDEDGRLDAMLGSSGTTSPRFFLLRGPERVPEEVSIPLPQETAVRDLDAADFDRDGHVDLLVTAVEQRCGSQALYRGDGRGGFTGPTANPRFLGTSAIVADMNEDGFPDAVTGCFWFTSFARLAVLLGGPAGELDPVTRVDTIGPFGGYVVGEFDGDGHLDVIAAIGLTGELQLLRGDGKGGLGAPRGVLHPGVWLAADLDGNGLSDLVGIASGGALSVSLNRCGSLGPLETRLLVPVFLSVGGASGSLFTSALTLVNRGVEPAVVEATATRAFGEPLAEVGAALLAAGQQRRVSYDGAFSLFGLPSPGFTAWTLRLRFTGIASPEEVFALASIAGGGVSFPAVPISEALTGPSTLGWLVETPRDRTNLALVNAGAEADGEVVLRVTVVSTDPAHPGSATLPDARLGPGGFLQHDRVLSKSGLAAASGFARVERVSGTAPYWTWATVNDNANADGSVVPPLRAGSRAPARTLVLPVLVESSSFESELVVTNASSVARRVAFEWVAEALASPDRTARFVLELSAGEQLHVPSFVEWLRGRGEPAVGPRGPTYAGALFATVEDGDAEGLFVGARTSSAGGGGRYGVFYSAVAPAETASASAWLYGLEQTSTTRTNLALVHTGAPGTEPDVFRIELFDGVAGVPVATLEDVVVPPRGWRQLSSILFTAAPGLAGAYARVTRTSGTGPFVAYAIVNAGAAAGTGDGTYLPMRVGGAAP